MERGEGEAGGGGGGGWWGVVVSVQGSRTSLLSEYEICTWVSHSLKEFYLIQKLIESSAWMYKPKKYKTFNNTFSKYNVKGCHI